jgi:hypothetical protein
VTNVTLKYDIYYLFLLFFVLKWSYLTKRGEEMARKPRNGMDFGEEYTFESDSQDVRATLGDWNSSYIQETGSVFVLVGDAEIIEVWGSPNSVAGEGTWYHQIPQRKSRRRKF